MSVAIIDEYMRLKIMNEKIYFCVSIYQQTTYVKLFLVNFWCDSIHDAPLASMKNFCERWMNSEPSADPIWRASWWLRDQTEKQLNGEARDLYYRPASGSFCR